MYSALSKHKLVLGQRALEHVDSAATWWMVWLQKVLGGGVGVGGACPPRGYWQDDGLGLTFTLQFSNSYPLCFSGSQPFSFRLQVNSTASGHRRSWRPRPHCLLPLCLVLSEAAKRQMSQKKTVTAWCNRQRFMSSDNLTASRRDAWIFCYPTTRIPLLTLPSKKTIQAAEFDNPIITTSRSGRLGSGGLEPRSFFAFVWHVHCAPLLHHPWWWWSSSSSSPSSPSSPSSSSSSSSAWWRSSSATEALFLIPSRVINLENPVSQYLFVETRARFIRLSGANAQFLSRSVNLRASAMNMFEALKEMVPVYNVRLANGQDEESRRGRLD